MNFIKKKLNSLNYKPNIIHKTLKLMEDKKLIKFYNNSKYRWL